MHVDLEVVFRRVQDALVLAPGETCRTVAALQFAAFEYVERAGYGD